MAILTTRSRIALWCACLLLVAACTPARKKVQTDVVRSISFQGNGRLFDIEQNDYLLASAMAQGESSFGVTTFPMLLWVQPVAYEPDLLQRDAYRIEVWYAHRGWFDAKFEGWEVVQVRPRRPRAAGVVEIMGKVDPGEPSTIRDFTIEGLDRPLHRQFESTIRRTGYVQEQDRFVLSNVEETRTMLQDLLANHGFPYASIVTSMEAWPEEHTVDVGFDTEPGTLARFGELTVKGDGAVSDQVIRESLTFESGEVFDARELRRSQRRLFQLGTFSVVNLTPDLSDPEQEQVPVEVAVTESNFRTLRLGGGLSYQGATLTPRVSGNFRHTNLFRRLIKLELDATAGYGFRPSLGPSLGLGSGGSLVYGTGLELSTPRLVGSDVGLVVSGSVEQDVQSGQYEYFNAKSSLAVTWKPTDSIVARVGPEWQLYEFRQLDQESQVIARALFGEDFENPYRLTKLDAQVIVDWRDDPVFTTRGAYYTAGLSQALPVTEWLGAGDPGGGFLYTQVSADARWFARPPPSWFSTRVPLTAALRVHGKALVPWGDRPLPYPEKVFQGGASNLRGFLVDQVGPYDTLCTHRESDAGDAFTNEPGAGEDVRVRHLPKGGAFGGSVQGELRYELTSSLSAAAFTDVGLLIDHSEDLNTESLRFGGGLGMRYASPVGPVRVDLAARPLYPEDAGPLDIVGCSPGDDVRPRSFDIFSALFPRSEQIGSRTVPFALNIYLAIGEAF